MTPIQVAAHADQQDMVKLLLSMDVDTTEFQKDCDRGLLSDGLIALYSPRGKKIKKRLYAFLLY